MVKCYEGEMASFDDVADRLKIAISSVEKKEEVKVKDEENIIQDKMFRRRMKEELKIQEMKLQMKSKDYEKIDKIVNEEDWKDEDWKEWTFLQLVDALRKWTTRNSKIILSPEKDFKHENAY